MGLVTCLLLLLMGANQHLASRLSECGRRGDKICPKCLAGHYQRSCGCVPCPAGTYTSGLNCEDSCLRCFSDCRSGLHLKVVKQCTNTSNLQCECKDGYICNAWEELSKNCRSCQRNEKYATIDPPVGQSSTSPQPCSISNGCIPSSISGNATEPRTDTTQNQLIAILCPLVIIGVALVLIRCLGCPGHETRFKQTMKKLCTSVETKDSAHQTRDASDQKQQTVPMATANMGPVHVHNPGTVIFSVLGEFSGQIGQAKEEKAEVKELIKDDAYCMVCQPTPSPAFPLSEEDRSGEHVFFPSQEQGKDSHVSKEEQL